MNRFMAATIFVCLCASMAVAQGGGLAVRPVGATGAATIAISWEGSRSGLDLQRRDARYRLCPSDVIVLTFPLTPEFDQTVSIQPDGFASLAGAGDVHLEGLSTQESVEAVRAAYAGILHDPIVSIDLKDFNRPYFIVGGQVGHPGKYDLRGETSATEAVQMAGGFTDASKHSQVLLFRRVNSGWYEVKPLNLKRILQGRDVNEDPQVQPGDMLFAVFASPRSNAKDSSSSLDSHPEARWRTSSCARFCSPNPASDASPRRR